MLARETENTVQQVSVADDGVGVGVQSGRSVEMPTGDLEARDGSGMRERFKNYLDNLKGEGVGEYVTKLLLNLLDDGYILDGIDSFGENQGVNNDLFSCFLGRKNAPEGTNRGVGVPFWNDGLERKALSNNAFIACVVAKIPLVLEMDGPLDSTIKEVMQTCWAEDEKKRITKLGNVGKKKGNGMLTLDDKMVKRWADGLISTQLSNGGTFTMNNMEETTGPDKRCKYTVKDVKAAGHVQKTVMGEMCYPQRGGVDGGYLIGKEKDGVRWSGSECMLFVKNGGMTTPHIDVQSVLGGKSGSVFDMPAAGTIRAVKTLEISGEPVKQAIVVHADDRDKVVSALQIDTGKESAMQYCGEERTLVEFASALRENHIRFVVMDFPWLCSYMLPASCAHVFITKGLVESAAWHPLLCSVDDMKKKLRPI